MARYIDRDKLMAELDREVELADNWKTAHEIANVVKYFPAADVPKEDTINELIKEISDRVIQALEANYEIIPKQPVVRCKECKYWGIHERLNIPWCREMHIDRGAEDFCSMAKRRDDDC